jgi:hypothetical protein
MSAACPPDRKGDTLYLGVWAWGSFFKDREGTLFWGFRVWVEGLRRQTDLGTRFLLKLFF